MDVKSVQRDNIEDMNILSNTEWIFDPFRKSILNISIFEMVLNGY